MSLIKAVTYRRFTTCLYIIVVLVQWWYIRVYSYMVISENFKNVVFAFYSFWLMLGGGHKLRTLNTWQHSTLPQRLYLHFTLLNFYKANMLYFYAIQMCKTFNSCRYVALFSSYFREIGFGLGLYTVSLVQ